MKNSLFRRINILVIPIILGLLLFISSVQTVSAALRQAQGDKPTFSYPRLANYFLDRYVYAGEAELLAPWDVLVLGPEVQDFQPEVFDILRAKNPDIIILAYVSSAGLRQEPASDEFPATRDLSSDRVPSEWYIKNSNGVSLGYWPGSNLLNVTDGAPLVNNEKWNEWLPDFIADSIYATGKWDGVFLDEGFELMSWLNGGDIDLDNNGTRDDGHVADEAWRAGMEKLVSNLRDRLGSKAYIVLNGSSLHKSNLNGRMLESQFKPGSNWQSEMLRYAAVNNGYQVKQLTLINSNTGNTGQIDEQHTLFSFASTLLLDGFFSFDHGDAWHQNIWWLPEYNIRLGNPLGAARDILNQENDNFAPGLWQRNYEQGVVLVNSADREAVYELELSGQKISDTMGPRTGRIIPHQGVVSQPTVAKTSPNNQDNTEAISQIEQDEGIRATPDIEAVEPAADEPDAEEEPNNRLAVDGPLPGQLEDIIEQGEDESGESGVDQQVIHKRNYFRDLMERILAIFVFLKSLV